MSIRAGDVISALRTATAAVALALMFVLTSGCATQAPLLHNVEFCCGPIHGSKQRLSLETYSLKFEAFPAFLEPTMRDALVAALGAKGFRPSPTDPEALITLRYSEVFDDANRPLANDGFGDPLAQPGGRPRKFDARVTLEIRRASDDAEVLRGVLSREHEVSVGEYDHERGRAQIRAGFTQLLNRLPAVARRS